MGKLKEFYHDEILNQQSPEPSDRDYFLVSVDVPPQVSKQGIRSLAFNIMQNAIDDGRVIRLAEGVAVLEKMVEAIRKDDAFIGAMVDELAKHPQGKVTTASGSLIEQVETGSKYDFSYDAEWCAFNAEVEHFTRLRKEREATLKSVKAGKQIVDEETGEVVTGASKTSKTNYRIVLPKGNLDEQANDSTALPF